MRPKFTPSDVVSLNSNTFYMVEKVKRLNQKAYLRMTDYLSSVGECGLEWASTVDFGVLVFSFSSQVSEEVVLDMLNFAYRTKNK